MTFAPVLPGPILAVVAAALIVARLVTLRQVFLVSRPARGTAALRWSGLTLAVLLVLAALARPGTGTVAPESATASPGGGPNVFVVLDRSPAAGVDDTDGRPRIDAMRADIDALTERYPQGRFAVLSFAARASLDWPLSADTFSLRPVLAAMTPYPPNPDAGVNTGAAANILRYQLIQATQQYPQTRNLVFYLGTGTADAQAPQTPFDTGAATVDGGAVLGYGTAPDDPALRAVADQLGVPYERRDPGASLDSLLPGRADTGGAVAETPRTEWYWLLMLLAAALLLAEIALTIRELRRNRAARRMVES